MHTAKSVFFTYNNTSEVFYNLVSYGDTHYQSEVIEE